MKRLSERPKTSRQIQAEKMKHKIFETARDLILEHGFDNVTIDEICATAGISKGLFYHYFNSKDEIIVIGGYAECDTYFEKKVRNKLKKEHSIERIIEFAGHQIGYAADVGVKNVIQIYKSQIQHGNNFFVSEERTLPTILREVIVDGQAKGEITTAMTSGYITNYILRFIRGLVYDWCLHNGGYDLKKTAHEDVRLLVELFRVP